MIRWNPIQRAAVCATMVLFGVVGTHVSVVGAAPVPSDIAWTPAAPTPPGADYRSISRLQALSCTSPGSCTAVGTYEAQSGAESFVMNESGGSWTTTADVPFPPDAAGSSGQTIAGIACPEAGNCTAATTAAFPNSQYRVSVLLVEQSGAWHAIDAPLPAGALVGASTTVGVSCPSATACVVVGTYDTTSGNGGYIDTGSGSSWSTSTIPLPSNAPADAHPDPSGVSCVGGASTPQCVIAASYTAANSTVSEIASGFGSSWNAMPAPLPANANAATTESTQADVACDTSGECLVAGTYDDQSDILRPFFDFGDGSTWSSTEGTLPPGATALEALGHSSCSGTQCTVLGSDLQGDLLAFNGAGTTWSTSVVPLPSDAIAGANPSLGPVSCGSDSCTAVGFYGSGSSSREVFVANENSGVWSSVGVPGSSISMSAIWCNPGGTCVGVGGQQTDPLHILPVVLSGSAGSWSFALQTSPADASYIDDF